MSTLLLAVAGSSLVGSLHCVAMCGPLIGLAGGTRSARFAALHSLGRLATYAGLGIAAGAVGRAVDLAGDLAVVQHTASIVAALVIIGWGGFALATALGWRTAGRARGKAFSNGLVQLRSRPPATRALLIGTLTGLLPCGWLWAFVVAAAGTGSPVDGGLTMLAFWAGTVPAMFGVLTFGGALLDRIRARIPAITAIVLIALGLGTLAMRWRDAGTTQVTTPSCHEVRS